MANKRRQAAGFLVLVCIVLSFKQICAQEGAADHKISLKSKSVDYKADNLEDPFKEDIEKAMPKKKTQPEKPLPGLAIQGIVWGGGFPQAIVNDKVLRVGDSIEDVRIIDISRNGLIVFFQDQEYKLSSPAKTNPKGYRSSPEGGIDEKQYKGGIDEKQY